MIKADIINRVAEDARITKVKPYVLRFWESEFKMMSPPKSRSKQRMYRRRDIDTILRIKKLLYEQGFTIKGARKKLVEAQRDEAAAAPSGNSVDLEEQMLKVRDTSGTFNLILYLMRKQVTFRKLAVRRTR